MAGVLVTPRLRLACLRILEAFDAVLAAAWRRLNPTVDEQLGRIAALTPDSDSLDDIYVEDGAVFVSDKADEQYRQAQIAELTWRLNHRRREYAAHGCRPYERDGNTYDLVHVPGPKGDAS